MDHVAILSKRWNLLDKIIAGEKTVESRWYKFRRAPWNKIVVGDVVYFKETAKLISAKAVVDKVLQFSDLNAVKIKEILDNYAVEIGIPFDKISSFAEGVKGKKYCILVFLKNVEKIQPFEINKRGFGLMSAWLCVEDIEKIKIL